MLGGQVNHQHQKIGLYHSHLTNTEYNTWLKYKFFFWGILRNPINIIFDCSYTFWYSAVIIA